MKIQYCSDLHLEFETNRNWIKNHPLTPCGEVLIIAGDTYYLNLNYSQLDFIKWVADSYAQCYIIPGNHEYYDGYDLSTSTKELDINVFSNVKIINNKSIVRDNIKFIFSTLWSQIRREPVAVMKGMMDFYKIKYERKNLSIHDYNHVHDLSFTFIKKEVEKKGRKIVISHHLPSNHCNAPEFKNSILNEAFCIDKTRFIEVSDIDYWIYGHSHRNMKTININDTQLITNQLGYVQYNEHSTFNNGAFIKI